MKNIVRDSMVRSIVQKTAQVTHRLLLLALQWHQIALGAQQDKHCDQRKRAHHQPHLQLHCMSRPMNETSPQRQLESMADLLNAARLTRFIAFRLIA